MPQREQCDLTYLTLRALPLLHTEPSLRHRLVNDPHRVRSLRRRIHTLLGHQRRDLLPQGCEIMLAFLLADLHFALLQDLFDNGVLVGGAE